MSRFFATRTHGVPLAAVVFTVAALGTAGPMAAVMDGSGRIQASEVVLSNLTGPENNVFGVQSGVAVATAFTTSAAPAGWFLESVKFPVRRDRSGSGFSVSVYDSVASQPGTALGSLSGSGNPPTGMQTYTAAGSGIPLDASTTYWLVWAASAGDYGITLTDNFTGTWSTPPGGARGWTSNGGATWNISSNGSAFQAELTASPVPEPSTYCMALGGLACGGYTIFRRRKQA